MYDPPLVPITFVFQFLISWVCIFYYPDILMKIFPLFKFAPLKLFSCVRSYLLILKISRSTVWSLHLSLYLWYDMIYLLTANGLSPGGRSTVHIYTQTIHRTIRNKQYIEQKQTIYRANKQYIEHLVPYKTDKRNGYVPYATDLSH